MQDTLDKKADAPGKGVKLVKAIGTGVCAVLHGIGASGYFAAEVSSEMLKGLARSTDGSIIDNEAFTHKCQLIWLPVLLLAFGACLLAFHLVIGRFWNRAHYYAVCVLYVLLMLAMPFWYGVLPYPVFGADGNTELMMVPSVFAGVGAVLGMIPVFAHCRATRFVREQKGTSR